MGSALVSIITKPKMAEASSSAPASNLALPRIINHVFLPPKLPQTDDSSMSDDTMLIEEFAAAWDLFRSYLPAEESSQGMGCGIMLKKMVELRDSSGSIKAEETEDALASMTQQGMLH